MRVGESASGDDLTGLLDRRLVFVTGKGGVGKTSVAAALASVAARSGRSTLICEMDAKGAVGAAFDVGVLDFEPRPVEPGLSAMAMNTEDALREYLRLFVRLPLVARIGPLARTFDFVADAAPGVKEILAVGKICYEVRERTYDLVVVDAEASGHIVAQIGAPRVIGDLVQVGLVRDQTRWMLDILEDPEITAVVAVTTPEEMPVVETLQLVDDLAENTGVGVGTVVVNRVLPEVLDPTDAAIVERIIADPTAIAALADLAGPSVRSVLDALSTLEARRRVGLGHLARLRQGLDERSPTIEVIAVPELNTRASGRRVVAQIADRLGESLGESGGASRREAP